MLFKVQNWPEYGAGLRRRGNLISWIEDAALEDGQSTGPGGQTRYTDAAVQISLLLRMAFKLELPQTEGLMASVLTLMGMTLSAQDHSKVNRRAVVLPVIQPAQESLGPLHVLVDSTGLQVYEAGQWLEAKHRAKSRRTWRKLHLTVGAGSGMIVAQMLMDQDGDDPSQVGPLPDQIDAPIVQVTADGACDGAPTYQTIAAYGDEIEVVRWPRNFGQGDKLVSLERETGRDETGKVTRKRYGAEFKAKVALDAIRGEQTLAELSAKHGIHQTMIAAWHRQAIEGLASTFSGKAEVTRLHAKIGQLVVERDFRRRPPVDEHGAEARADRGVASVAFGGAAMRFARDQPFGPRLPANRRDRADPGV